MRVPTKFINLMGGSHTIGGVALTPNHKLWIVYNDINKLVRYNLLTEEIEISTNALGYADYCECESLCYLDDVSEPVSVVLLLKNGEVWQKKLTDYGEIKWGETETPEGIGAEGIEYHAGNIFLAYPQDNTVKKRALVTLNLISTYTTGVPTDNTYPPTSLTYDAVDNQFIAVDPVKGDIVFLDDSSLQEIGREYYMYNFYNRCWDGDIAAAKWQHPDTADTYFIGAVDNRLIMYAEPWFKLYEVDDLAETYTEVESIDFENTKTNEESKKHLRIENTTDLLKNSLVVHIADDPSINVDDYLELSLTESGTWSDSLELGDLSGYAVMDFWIRFFPQSDVVLGSFTVPLVIDYVET